MKEPSYKKKNNKNFDNLAPAARKAALGIHSDMQVSWHAFAYAGPHCVFGSQPVDAGAAEP